MGRLESKGYEPGVNAETAPAGHQRASGKGMSFTEMMKQARPKEPTGIVYFVQGSDADVVKIGFTTNLGQRLGDFQSFCHVGVFLCAAMPGNQFDERDLHRRFERYRVRGEWFALKTPIIRKIESLRRKPFFETQCRYYQPWQLIENAPTSTPRLSRRNGGVIHGVGA